MRIVSQKNFGFVQIVDKTTRFQFQSKIKMTVHIWEACMFEHIGLKCAFYGKRFSKLETERPIFFLNFRPFSPKFKYPKLHETRTITLKIRKLCKKLEVMELTRQFLYPRPCSALTVYLILYFKGLCM